ncbi:MAG: Signal transduction histidine kinase, partial [Acidimicrobiaceae bacterium]|nr:Signal transduction histidine kinase [Acidimicrobiaceae bacterium]
MTSPIDLAREYTGLDLGARQHLERLMGAWSLLADLSFADLLLYVPLDQFSLAVAEPPPEPPSHGRGFGHGAERRSDRARHRTLGRSPTEDLEEALDAGRSARNLDGEAPASLSVRGLHFVVLG